MDLTSLLMMTKRDFNMIISTLLSKSAVSSIPVNARPTLIRCIVFMMVCSVTVFKPHVFFYSVFSDSSVTTFSALKDEFIIVGSMNVMLMLF